MKEFVEKLIERLEQLKADAINEDCQIVPNSEDCEMEYSCASCYLNAVIKFVNQLAEAYKMGDISDGYHTFNELYHHRAVLFATICNSYKELAWKSKLHDTGDMYSGMFIVGIETPKGQATYHYDINPYWDMFKVTELPKAPKWDGHTPDEAIRRIAYLDNNQGWIPCSERLPETDEYILLSFENFSIPVVGRYEEDEEGGEFYAGDEDESCVKHGLFVNAWMPLPETYKPKENTHSKSSSFEEKPNFYSERFNKVQ